MKIVYSEASRDDVTRQFRYYLVKHELPDVAIRFKESVRKTAKAIRETPSAAPPYRLRNPQLQSLRSWPVVDFEALRFYFLVEDDTIRVIRILHGKRNVKPILEYERLT